MRFLPSNIKHFLHSRLQPSSQALSSPERKRLVWFGHLAPTFREAVLKIEFCYHLVYCRKEILHFHQNKRTGTFILLVITQNVVAT